MWDASTPAFIDLTDPLPVPHTTRTKPSYQGETGLDVERQPPWTMLAVDRGPDLPIGSSGQGIRLLAGGTLESSFESSFALHEKLQGEPQRCGLHPSDDFRQNISAIAKTLDGCWSDDKAPCFMIQDPEQTVGCIISVRDIRQVGERSSIWSEF